MLSQSSVEVTSHTTLGRATADTFLTLHVHVQALVAIDVEDLEVDATPEDLMLSYVSGEKGKVRLWAIPMPPWMIQVQLSGGAEQHADMLQPRHPLPGSWHASRHSTAHPLPGQRAHNVREDLPL